MGVSAIGVEINNNEVRMAQFDGRSLRTAALSMPENVVRSEGIVAPEILAKTLKKLKRDNKFRGNTCCLILPESATFFRSMSQPPISEAQLELNLPYEFRDYVGSDSVHYSYDYALDSVEYDEFGKPVSFNIFAGAARKETVEEYADSIRRAGFKLKSAFPREMAFINLLKKSSFAEEERPVCVIDAGYEHTNVYIIEKGNLMASKIIDIGCVSIDEAIASEFHVDVYLAASYRETDYKGACDCAPCQVIYERLAVEIMKTVNFYSYENAGIDFAGVCFCGDGSNISALKKEISDRIQLSEQDVLNLLPEGTRADESANHCLVSAGAAI